MCTSTSTVDERSPPLGQECPRRFKGAPARRHARLARRALLAQGRRTSPKRYEARVVPTTTATSSPVGGRPSRGVLRAPGARKARGIGKAAATVLDSRQVRGGPVLWHAAHDDGDSIVEIARAAASRARSQSLRRAHAAETLSWQPSAARRRHREPVARRRRGAAGHAEARRWSERLGSDGEARSRSTSGRPRRDLESFYWRRTSRAHVAPNGPRRFKGNADGATAKHIADFHKETSRRSWARSRSPGEGRRPGGRRRRGLRVTSRRPRARSTSATSSTHHGRYRTRFRKYARIVKVQCCRPRWVGRRVL